MSPTDPLTPEERRQYCSHIVELDRPGLMRLVGRYEATVYAQAARLAAAHEALGLACVALHFWPHGEPSATLAKCRAAYAMIDGAAGGGGGVMGREQVDRVAEIRARHAAYPPPEWSEVAILLAALAALEQTARAVCTAQSGAVWVAIADLAAALDDLATPPGESP